MGKTRNCADLDLGRNTMAMQNIAFSADADLLDRAEQIAKAKGTTLEEEVRQWLDDFGAGMWKVPPREPRKRKARKSVKD
jgi:hypothetical protein